MRNPADNPQPDAATVLEWRAQGLSLAEIGHRLGLSAERLREVLAEAGADPHDLDDGPDDHRPNTAEVR